MTELTAEIAILGGAGESEKEQSLSQGQAIPSRCHSSHSPRLSPSPKSWEKSEWKGTTHRTWRNIQRYIWDDLDKPAIEKKFLLKLDFFLLSYTCLGYFCKNLD
jgi:ACS family pantothenate transporter-like MFS transporter